MKPTRPSRNNALAWGSAGFLALLYFATSLVVVVNAFVWTATFPSLWYTVQRVLYWPFGPYLDFAVSLLGGPDVSYQIFVLIARLPFLVVPIIVW
ncbi:MAG: hypothetical protein Q7O66_10920, partial [Dehalococcoidia bacterium]|nr:hypothetical protein [Dehalococcoidia bacterium]